MPLQDFLEEWTKSAAADYGAMRWNVGSLSEESVARKVSNSRPCV